MKPFRIPIQFILINIAIAIVVIFGITHSSTNNQPSSTPSTYQPKLLVSPSPAPAHVHLTTSQTITGSGYVSLKCPPLYGPHNIACTTNTSVTDEVQLVGYETNVHEIDTFGAFCGYRSVQPIEATIDVDCDKEYYRVAGYNATEFSPGDYTVLPSLYQLWDEQTAQKIGENRYEISLSCSNGYQLEDVMCNLREGVHTEGKVLESASIRDDQAVCTYQSAETVTAIIRVHCRK